MNVTNISLLISVLFMVIVLNISILAAGEIKEKDIKDKYYKKIEYALSSSMSKKYDLMDPINLSKLSTGEINVINYENMYSNFTYMLNKNFNTYVTPNFDVCSYLDKYIVMLDKGIMINAKNVEGERMWLELIPYTIYYDDQIYKFNLSDAPYIIDDKDIKKLAIINTLRRNILIENDNSTLFKLPYEDGIYNSINNQTVIATFTDFPIINGEKVNISVMSGDEIKEKNVYYINKNNKYEKISRDELSEDDMYFETKREAGKYFYPEI